MRLILQLGLMVLLLLGAGNRVWGKVAVGETIAVRDFAESGVFVSVRDAPPGLMSSGEAAVWGHDLGMQDGPNLYAYVRQNPWTSFDPDGLAEMKHYRQTKDRRVIKYEADPKNNDRPLTRIIDGKLQVQAHYYNVDPLVHTMTNYKGEMQGNHWVPAEQHGFGHLTSSAKGNAEKNSFHWNNFDPSTRVTENVGGWGDAANKPLVKGLNTAIRTTFTEGTSLIIGGAVAGALVLRSSANVAKGLGNPFKGKSAQEIHEMFISKGFQPRGPSPITGKGGYVNPKNGRSYHIDEANNFGEAAHVDVNRLRSYNGSLEKKKLDMGGSPGS